MLRRKFEEVLKAWKTEPNRKPMVIKGIRQCGKTYIALKFAKANYKNVVYVNFVLTPSLISAFTGSKDVDTILLNLSAMIPDAGFTPGETCLILDEIQDCPDARTSLKSFMIDGRYDVIATGSLLGVKGYGEKQKKENDGNLGKNSIPVGYETVYTMYPLDFEEFLWANGVSSAVLEKLEECYDQEKPVPDGVHAAMQQLLLRYAVVGGLPEAVNTFLETNNINKVIKVQRDIVSDYEEDMTKYASDEDKPHIRECFESIPSQLAKENKKFQFSTIKKGARSSQYLGSLQWLEDAGMICRCYNTHLPDLPYSGNAKDDFFKVYVTDIGILMAMLDYGTQANILQGDLYGYKGAIYENLIADMLIKAGRPLYYFRRDTGLELDFLLQKADKNIAVEVKPKNGKGKSMDTVLKHPEIYHLKEGIKLGQYNVGRNGNLLTIPLYMAYLLGQTKPLSSIDKIDIDALNALC